MAKAPASRGPALVEQLADWVLAPRAQDIPEAAIAQAKMLVLDTIGCGYAAFQEEAAYAVLETLKLLGGAQIDVGVRFAALDFFAGNDDFEEWGEFVTIEKWAS